MRLIQSVGHAAAAPLGLCVRAIIAGTDAANRLVSRWSERFDAHFSASTRLLRGRYAHRAELAVSPPPTVSGVADRADLLTGIEMQTVEAAA